MSREDIDLVANSEDAVNINFLCFENTSEYSSLQSSMKMLLFFQIILNLIPLIVCCMLQVKSNYAGVPLRTSILM